MNEHLTQTKKKKKEMQSDNEQWKNCSNLQITRDAIFTHKTGK